MSEVSLSDEQIQKLLQGVSIPPQPQIMVDLQIEQLDPDCSINSISKLIGQDIGLSGSILKTINSPYFNLPNRISSVRQAISLIGITGVINIVNSLSIRSALSDESIIQMTKIWDSAMDIAAASAAISHSINLAEPDEAYALGLFHNCGNILMMQRFPEFPSVLVQSYRQTDQRVVDLENEILKTNHAVVGYYVGKTWKLPAIITNAIALHHSTAQIFADHHYADNALKSLLAVLKIAEHICGNYRVLGNQTVDNEWAVIETDILEYTGMSEYDFKNLRAHIDDLGLSTSQAINFAA